MKVNIYKSNGVLFSSLKDGCAEWFLTGVALTASTEIIKLENGGQAVQFKKNLKFNNSEESFFIFLSAGDFFTVTE